MTSASAATTLRRLTSRPPYSCHDERTSPSVDSSETSSELVGSSRKAPRRGAARVGRRGHQPAHSRGIRCPLGLVLGADGDGARHAHDVGHRLLEQVQHVVHLRQARGSAAPRIEPAALARLAHQPPCLVHADVDLRAARGSTRSTSSSSQLRSQARRHLGRAPRPARSAARRCATTPLGRAAGATRRGSPRARPRCRRVVSSRRPVSRLVCADGIGGQHDDPRGGDRRRLLAQPTKATRARRPRAA